MKKGVVSLLERQEKERIRASLAHLALAEPASLLHRAVDLALRYDVKPVAAVALPKNYLALGI